MARIADSKGREDDNSGYTRLLGNRQLGQLLSRIHATVIRNGNELEDMLARHCPYRATGLKERVSGALVLFTQPREVYFGEALHIRPGQHQAVADVVILDNTSRRAIVVELKDGDEFDTKKADGELRSIAPLATAIGERLDYTPEYFFCCFNQEDKQVIVRGAKGRFAEEHVMTGREICELLAVDWRMIRDQRERDRRENLRHFVSELSAMPEIMAMLRDTA